jgi:hypothetical protein
MKAPIRHDRQPEHTLAKLDLEAKTPHLGRMGPGALASGAAERLDERIANLRETIAAAARKRAGLDAAIASRKLALSRLLAQLVLERGAAPISDE